LQENNGRKVPNSYHPKKEFKNKPKHNNINYKEREQILLNNMIGFAVSYPHSNCRPYPDSVWMLGWLCTDYHRVRSLDSQYLIIEALIRRSLMEINPKSINKMPAISTNLKKHLRGFKEEELTEKNIEKKKKKKHRDKGIGLYAPYYHKKTQQLYESLGFEKIAKIGNYYTTDTALFDSFYIEECVVEINEKYKNDAFLYCRGDLAHCRLLLGMEYFNYKKWPKRNEIDTEKEHNEQKKEEKNTEQTIKKKHGPKILEEYLQRRIADYHAKQQKEHLLLRQNKNKKSSSKSNEWSKKKSSSKNNGWSKKESSSKNNGWKKKESSSKNNGWSKKKSSSKNNGWTKKESSSKNNGWTKKESSSKNNGWSKDKKSSSKDNGWSKK